jgi:hypothetical protein
MKTMRRLKELLHKVVWLKTPNYDWSIIVTIDTSLTRKYAQVKRELWCIVSAVKTNRDYLIGAKIMIKTDCLLVLGMLRCCTIPDVAMHT